MNKSSGAISLVLLGTALALAGCSSQSEEEEGDWPADGGQGGRMRVVARSIGPGFGGGIGRGGSVRADAFGPGRIRRDRLGRLGS